jgi:hypothetical protein
VNRELGFVDEEDGEAKSSHKVPSVDDVQENLLLKSVAYSDDELANQVHQHMAEHVAMMQDDDIDSNFYSNESLQ